MVDSEFNIRCQRCGDPMDLKDPAPGEPWTALQFWTCARCGRHFWTTYVTKPGAEAPAKAAPAAAEAPAAAPPPPPVSAPADSALNAEVKP